MSRKKLLKENDVYDINSLQPGFAFLYPLKNGLLQVPSQWTILHTSQVLLVSSSKRYIVYTCICVLRFLSKNIFYYMYIFKMGKTIKKKKKKERRRKNSESLLGLLMLSGGIEKQRRAVMG